MQSPWFVNQPMAFKIGKRLKLRDDSDGSGIAASIQSLTI